MESGFFMDRETERNIGCAFVGKTLLSFFMSVPNWESFFDYGVVCPMTYAKFDNSDGFSGVSYGNQRFMTND